MRYFDRILSEELSKEESREFNDLLNDLRKDKNNQQLLRKLYGFKEKHPEEFGEWVKNNRDNPDFKEAVEQAAHSGDNLVTWMLRHLVQKAQSGT